MTRCDALIFEGTTPHQCEKEAPHDGEKHINMDIQLEWEMWIND
jgi:hypothetical protein